MYRSLCKLFDRVSGIRWDLEFIFQNLGGGGGFIGSLTLLFFVKIIKSSVIYEQNLMNFCCQVFNLKFLIASSASLKIFMISMTGSAFTAWVYAGLLLKLYWDSSRSLKVPISIGGP